MINEGLTLLDRALGLENDARERAAIWQRIGQACALKYDGERFWQAETGDHRRYGGVGLGLYLVRQIIERQNGWVSLRPRERGGTVAEVRLRRADGGPGEV